MKIKTLKWSKILSDRRGKLVVIGYQTQVRGFLYQSLYKQPDGSYEGRGKEWGSKRRFPTLMDGINTIQAEFEAEIKERFLDD